MTFADRLIVRLSKLLIEAPETSPSAPPAPVAPPAAPPTKAPAKPKPKKKMPLDPSPWRVPRPAIDPQPQN